MKVPGTYCLVVVLPFIAAGFASADTTSIATTQVEATTNLTSSNLSQQLRNTGYGDGGEMILQFYIRDILLSDGLFAQVSDGAVYLPLSELLSLLDLAILVDPAAGRASGWAFDAENSFELNVEAGEARVAGNRYPLSARSVLEDEFDLYVNVEDLQRWFPFQFDFHLSSQVLVLRSSKALPAELARQRADSTLSTETVFEATRPFTVPGYRAVDWPAVAFNIGGFANSESSTPDFDYNVVASGDFAFMNGTLAASGDDQELSSLRLTLGRADPSGLFGPLALADYEIGDTSQFLPGLIGNSLSGRGIRFGNSKLSGRRDFDTLDLKGLLQPDYEVELYVNERLIDVDRSSTDGLYEFTDVPLRLGQNVVRLEFYGPQGQRYAETTRHLVGEGQNRPGQFIYEFTSLQPGRLVFENINDTVEARAENQPDNQISTALDFSYGLTTRSTVGVTIAHLADSRDDDTSTVTDSLRNNLSYVDARFNTSFAGLFFTYNLAIDDESEKASSFGLKTRTRSHEYSVEYVEYDDEYRRFSDLQFDTTDNLPKRRLSADVTGTLSRRAGSGVASWGISTDYDRQRDDTENLSISARLDARRKYLGGSWVHVASHNLDTNSTNQSGSVGLVIQPGSKSQWSYRAELDYLDSADSFVQDATFGAYRRLANRGSLAFQANRSLIDQANRYSASWNRQFKKFRFSSTIAGSSSDDVSMRLGADFSVGRTPGSFLPEFNGDSTLSSPRLGVLVFVDDNNNQLHDENEEVVEGVPITRNGLLTSAVTDKNGYAVMNGLSARTSVDVGIVSSGVQNPELRMIATAPGILPRPGRLPIVQIPLVRVRDIEGTVTIGNGSPAPNVRMTLQPLDEGGESIEIKTEFDGIYFFTDIPLGRYRLVPDSEQLAKLNLDSQPASIVVDVSKNIPVLGEQNFNLARRDTQQAKALNNTPVITEDKPQRSTPTIGAAHQSPEVFLKEDISNSDETASEPEVTIHEVILPRGVTADEDSKI